MQFSTKAEIVKGLNAIYKLLKDMHDTQTHQLAALQDIHKMQYDISKQNEEIITELRKAKLNWRVTVNNAPLQADTKNESEVKIND